MNFVLGKIKSLRKKPFRKIISDYALFENIELSHAAKISYNPDHNLDEECWFKIEQFSKKDFCIDLLKTPIDSKDHSELAKNEFEKIAYIASIQDLDVYFQKLSPSLFIKRKTITFGEVAQVEEGSTRIIVNKQPDAIYLSASDTLVFKNLAVISSIFKGIDTLYREATDEEVAEFLKSKFITLSPEYNSEKVSIPNRKRISLALETLEKISLDDRKNLHLYIDEYCKDKVSFDKKLERFEITTDDDLKLLLYGIEQRFYTTLFGSEKRIANSIQAF